MKKIANKTKLTCFVCKKDLLRFKCQIQPHNFCSKECRAIGVGLLARGKHHSEEWKRKIAESERLTKANPEWHLKWNLKFPKSPKSKYSGYSGNNDANERRRESNIKTWQNPELRKRLSETRKKQGNFRSGVKLSNATKELMRIRGKERFMNPEYIKKFRKGLRIRPTEPEKFIMEILQKHFPNEWKYTGDFSFWIENKNPDFINVNGLKAIIEFDGDYWHSLPKMQLKDKERNEIYARYGYKVLMLKYADIKDEEILINKIENLYNVD